MALEEPPEEVQCEYFGLNHLGWVRSIKVRDEPVMGLLLTDDEKLRRLYPVELFQSGFLRTLGLIPTEYLYYYYCQQQALDNQRSARVTRGEELDSLNQKIWAGLATNLRAGRANSALQVYRRYLNRRNTSYMRLDGAGESALIGPDPDWDPFEGATGYHRIAVSAIRALTSSMGELVVLNVANQGCFAELNSSDIVEMPCVVDQAGPRTLAARQLPEAVRGLLVAVKEYERMTVRAAVERRWDIATLALAINPIVGNWNAAKKYLHGLADRDREHFAGYARHDILQA
jgi:6-phospho-beta-glucosidase